MFLPIMAVWIFLAVADVMTCQHVNPNCCDEGTDDIKEEIIKCFEQKAGRACGKHFFIVETNDGTRFCINPQSQWFKDKKEKENITCHPIDGHRRQKLDVAAKPKKKH